MADNIEKEAKLFELLENIRVETPHGNTPLRHLLEDIYDGWSEIENYRDGSLALYQDLDERLNEELEINPNSDAVIILKKAKSFVYSFYLNLLET